MNVFKLIKRLEAVERDVAELRAGVGCPSGQEETEKPSSPAQSDAKLREGIANLMGYDPLLRKRSDEI